MLTPEQAEAQRLQNNQQIAQQAAIATLVEERSKALLYMCLNAEQREMLEKHSKFRVVSNKGNIFEICRGRTHNVFKLDMQGNRIQEWCVLPPGSIPENDVLVSQKVSLESDEDATYEVANVWVLPSRQMIHRGVVQHDWSDSVYRPAQRAA